MGKKVLIVTYYWPPSGGPGVQRVLNFVKYLPLYGWEPVVLTVREGEYPAKDVSLEKEIPSGLKVFKTKTFEPFALFKLVSGKKQNDSIGTYILSEKSPNLITRISKWIRFNLFIPDARVGWKKFAVREGEKIVREETVDLILTSSPPHSVQLIGQVLAQKTGLPWVADYRDPWKEIVYNQNQQRTAWAEKRDGRLERMAINRADGIVTISRDIQRLLEGKCECVKPVKVVFNGYDNKPEPLPRNECPIITYTGALSETRVPTPLLPALAQLREEGVRFRLKFIGNICPEFRRLVEEHGFGPDTEFIPYLPHSESVRNINGSDVLLLVIDNVPNNKGILTGKLFEYIGARRPILAIGNTEGEARQIIDECQCGEMLDYADVEGVKRVLREWYACWREGKVACSFANSSAYSRKSLTGELARFLDEIMARREGK